MAISYARRICRSLRVKVNNYVSHSVELKSTMARLPVAASDHARACSFAKGSTTFFSSEMIR